MKYLFYVILFLIIISCRDKTNIVSKSISRENLKDTLVQDTVLTFLYEKDFRNPSIINSSDRKVDLLFNGVEGYLKGKQISDVKFRTECFHCEPVQEYKEGLLLAKRFLITQDQAIFYKRDILISDSVDIVKSYTDYKGRSDVDFKFRGGKASVSYIGISCNDASYYKVKLSYPTGTIEVDSLINASFFEYDLNRDGQKEQYLLGRRNCSYEMVLLRIRKSDD